MLSRQGLVLIVFILGFVLPLQAGWKVKVIRHGDKTTFIGMTRTQSTETAPRLLSSMPSVIREDGPPSKDLYEEYVVPESPQIEVLASQMKAQPWKDSEVRTIVQQGPPANRINLTIVGDGYQLAEKEKFFQDAKRTTDDLFQGKAFTSYLPLFNVYAVFVPSNESGLSDGTLKDTALKLYRDPPGSKRAIMPGDTVAAQRAVALAPATDYPILIANDDFYGGLGGQYAISTRSVRSGKIVLRHELGHNFGGVGEEYDGGYVYMGANHSDTAEVTWRPWVEGTLKVNEVLHLAGDYMWQNLSGSPVTMNFDFPNPDTSGKYSLLINFSSVGWETPDDVHAFLDGQRRTFQGDFNNDRNFYGFPREYDVKPGQHHLEFKENISDKDNVLAYVQIYALAEGYDMTHGKIGAYASYDSWDNKIGYRPTHDSCLMNDMLSPSFCAVDLENMWHRFLNRVDIIDSVETTIGSGRIDVHLHTAPLKGLQISWFKIDGQGRETELPEHRGQTDWSASPGSGSFRVRVNFVTPEVRTYSPRFTSTKDFTL